MTGFDRNLIDKLAHFRVNGHWFALFGVANILAYCTHLFMDEKNYRYHFGYGNGSGSGTGSGVCKVGKSMVGSE